MSQVRFLPGVQQVGVARPFFYSKVQKNDMATNFTVGILLAAVIGWAGFRWRALTADGAWAAVLVGAAIYAFGGWQWGALIIVFFASSSVLSFFRRSEKKQAAEKFEKGSRRDMAQVLANGGVAALAAIMAGIFPHPFWTAMFIGAISTVTADTWATELGVLSRETPRLITSGKPVPRGTSGGVTWWGTAAAAGGALLIGVAAWLLGISAGNAMLTVAVGVGGGLAGAMADSLLGATVQIVYRCPHCGQATEQRYHHSCQNTPTRRLRGITGINNDVVNGLSAAIGAAVAAIFTFF